MKTTIDLPDELLEQVRRVARSEGATLRGLVEEGLQRSLEARRSTARRQLDFPSYGAVTRRRTAPAAPSAVFWPLCTAQGPKSSPIIAAPGEKCGLVVYVPSLIVAVMVFSEGIP